MRRGQAVDIQSPARQYSTTYDSYQSDILPATYPKTISISLTMTSGSGPSATFTSYGDTIAHESAKMYPSIANTHQSIYAADNKVCNDEVRHQLFCAEVRRQHIAELQALRDFLALVVALDSLTAAPQV